MTYEPQSNGGSPSHDHESTLCAADSPASHSVSQGSNSEPLTNDGCGRQWQASYAEFDPDMSWWRTSAALFEMDLPSGKSSPTLHRLGFDAEWATLRASDFGAPTPRERVYLLAHPASINGESRHRLGARRIGAASFAIGGLSGPPAHTRGRLAREWLAREPRVDRLADGIPRQVDRLRVIGNAVVPQVAEHIGRQLLAAMEAAA